MKECTDLPWVYVQSCRSFPEVQVSRLEFWALGIRGVMLVNFAVEAAAALLARSLRPPTPPYSHAVDKELWVSGAGGVGCTVNGLYTLTESLNGRPKYQQAHQPIRLWARE